MVRPAYLPLNPHHSVLVHLRVGVLWQIETNLCRKVHCRHSFCQLVWIFLSHADASDLKLFSSLLHSWASASLVPPHVSEVSAKNILDKQNVLSIILKL